MSATVFKRLRQKPARGDIYAFKLSDLPFGFCAVVRDMGKSMEGTVLIYVFDAFSEDPNDVPPLSAAKLLIPPIIVGAGLWRSGYFIAIPQHRLAPEDELPRHCFFDSTMAKETYRDENKMVLDRRIEPCGDWSMAGLGILEHEVKKALGVSFDIDKDYPNPFAQAARGAPVTIAIAAPTDNAASVALDEIEEAIEGALAAAKLGEVEGHEIGADGAQIFIVGRDKLRIVDAIVPILKEFKLPHGSMIKISGRGKAAKSILLD